MSIDMTAARRAVRAATDIVPVDFANSVGMRFVLSERRHCAKLFANGKVHVTGVVDPVEARVAIEDRLRGLEGRQRGEPLKLKLDNGAIMMANYVVRMGYCIMLARLYEALASSQAVPSTWVVVYDPNIHASLKIRTEGATVLCFHTGSVIVSCNARLEAAARDVGTVFALLSQLRSRTEAMW